MLVSDVNTSITCDFTSSNQCGYWSFNDHVWYQWQLMYKDTLSNGIHSFLTSTAKENLSFDNLLIVGYVNKFFSQSSLHFFIWFCGFLVMVFWLGKWFVSKFV